MAARFAEMGAPFYLLTDSGYSSTEQSTVRLEANTYSTDEYGGVDILVYRVPDPLEFLKKQKDPHRLNLKGNYRGEGAANALRYLWDEWYARSRQAWQRVFSASARSVATDALPALKAPPVTRTRYTAVKQYQPLKGFELVNEFRYPLQVAKPEDPGKVGKLAGSSSEFVKPGNVRVPLGKLKPGLYIVEGYLGSYRAATLLFVSDSVLLTKVSSEQMLAWTVNKQTGAAVADSQLVWSDGNGVLKSGDTDKDGTVIFSKKSPEQSFVYGLDPQGGALVSESFYYPAEVHNSKIYVVTDRPLYRPGDKVNVSLVGRKFDSARAQQVIEPEKVGLLLRDPAGTELTRRDIQLNADGATTQFTLPDNAVAGGYELRMVYQNTTYAAPFRVAEYTKPHYDISIDLDQAKLKTGDEVSGKVSMRYPDGRPVAGASVELVLRSQRVSMVNDEIQYQGLFPLKLRQDTLKLDANGRASFKLPAAAEPSRYVLRVIGSQAGAYPVTASREVLIDSSVSRYRIVADKQFGVPNETSSFKLISDWPGKNKPVSWRAQRLEDRSVQTGALAANAQQLVLPPMVAGNYQISLLDAAGQSLGQSSFIISGKGMNVPLGSISLLFDRETYQVGDTAVGKLTFAEDVSDALLTLELENVQEKATLAQGGDWLKLKKISARQWEIQLPIKSDYRPNMSFSVLYVKHGSHAFQNRGLAVLQPKIDVAIKADRKSYQPGEIVTLAVSTRIAGKGAPAQLSLGVVDEMVYLLQAEITPDIYDYFYHPRRNAVRTSASLNFYGYDMAWSPRANDQSGMNYSSRSQKMLVRPRRDNMDTAYWHGALKTDANGQLKVQFRMPDALSRWRMTARAIDKDGVVGQITSYINSDKPAYLQWAAAKTFRENDVPRLTVAITQQGEAAPYQLIVRAGNAPQQEQTVNVPKGTSYLPITLGPIANGSVTVELKQNGQLIDRLITDLNLLPAAERGAVTQSQSLVFKDGKVDVTLPADAQRLRLQLNDSGDAAFRQVIDDLLDYPYGCVEQTASRLLPLSLAYEKLSDAPAALREPLRQRIAIARLRLLKMSGTGAVFSWWGDSTEGDPLLSAYARLAESRASRALGLTSRLNDSKAFQALYAAQIKNQPALHQALTLWMAAENGEATRTQLSGLLTQMQAWPALTLPANASANVMNEPDLALGQMAALVLASRLAEQQKLTLSEPLKKASTAAQATLKQRPEAWLQALAAWSRKDQTDAARILTQLSQDTPTFERSLALLWLQDGWKTAPASKVAPQGDWRKINGGSGGVAWQLRSPVQNGKLSIQLAKAPSQLNATLRFDSADRSQSALPVEISRQLYVLIPKGKNDAGFTAKPVEWGSKLASDKLYIDEIVLDAKKAYRYGMVEAALPPGAMVEEQHWGLNIAELAGQATYLDNNEVEQNTLPVQPMQLRPLGYAQPVALVDAKNEVVLRQIIRFTQAGRFSLPPARYFRMYQANESAYEAGGVRALEIR